MTGRTNFSLPLDDYLLVTKVPNFLAKNRTGHPKTWPQLITFEGCKGLGTRAAELLVEPAMEKLSDLLGGATAFQALFRASELHETADGVHQFTNIELLDWSVTGLDRKLTQSDFDRAHRLSLRMRGTA
jgi:hypothetical protein